MSAADHPVPSERARELVRGAYDTHVHVAPDVVRRRVTDVELARRFAALGLVTTKRGELESKDDLKRRIEEAARHAPLEQLCLSPQCGFSSTVEGNALTEQEQIAKLGLIVETAREVWG